MPHARPVSLFKHRPILFVRIEIDSLDSEFSETTPSDNARCKKKLNITKRSIIKKKELSRRYTWLLEIYEVNYPLQSDEWHKQNTRICFS
jgi:hypothetical protein